MTDPLDDFDSIPLPASGSGRDAEVAQLRTPPHSVEAEQSVLGGLLLDNSTWDRAAELVGASDFYRYEHRVIFQAMSDLIQGSKPVDVITVHERLQSMGKRTQRGEPAPVCRDRA